MVVFSVRSEERLAKAVSELARQSHRADQVSNSWADIPTNQVSYS
jgi:hypothetical protein